MKELFAMLSIGCLLVGCMTRPGEPEMKTVRGDLKHFPSNVRSSEAWHGHHFMIGNTPVIPTERVSEDTLKRFVGTLVTVTGIWHPGEEWRPTAEEMNMPMPYDLNPGVVVRGDGLKALAIRRLE